VEFPDAVPLSGTDQNGNIYVNCSLRFSGHEHWQLGAKGDGSRSCSARYAYLIDQNKSVKMCNPALQNIVLTPEGKSSILVMTSSHVCC
jgi:hypothetical protein